MDSQTLETPNIRGRKLGIDFGKSRIGISICDIDGLLATPLTTLSNQGDSEYVSEIAELKTLIDENSIVLIYCGYPLSLNGAETPSTQAAVEFAKTLQQGINIPVRMVDERLTTVTASSRLQTAGKNTKKQRSVIDQASAVILLQDAIDYERRFAKLAGKSLTEDFS